MFCRVVSSILFILLVMVCLVPAGSNAIVYTNTCETEGFWQYKVKSDNTARIVGYMNPDVGGILVIPDEINGYPVTAVEGLNKMKQITKVIIPDSVTFIAADTFIYDEMLEKVILPSSLEFIGRSAFRYTALTSVEIPGSVKMIALYAFSDSPLETVRFFSGEILTISGNPFIHTCIDHFSVPEDHPNLAAYQGVLFDKNEKKLISYPSSSTNLEYAIPNGIRIIGENAFEGTSPESIIIPDTTVKIEDCAFAYNESIKSINLGNGLISIGNDAFRSCSLLSNIVIPESVQHIGHTAFLYCDSLTEISVSDQNPFFCTQNQCLIEKDCARIISFPNGLDIENLEIPDGIITVGESAFEGTRIKNIVLSESVRVLEDSAFFYVHNLQSIQLNNGLMSIGSSCFLNSDTLTHITVPRSVGRFGYDVFCETDQFSVQVEKGSYAESYCQRMNIPFTYISSDQETGKIPISSPILGFSEMPADDIRNNAIEFLQGIKAGKELPRTDQDPGFPGILNTQELYEFASVLFDFSSSSTFCPECMEGTWLISLKYNHQEKIGDYVLYSTEVHCFAGQADQIFNQYTKADLINICFARNGILYVFTPTLDFSVSVSAFSEEILGFDNNWTLETFDEDYISWEYFAEEDNYYVHCVSNQDREDSEEVNEIIIRYASDGRCLGSVNQ